MKLARENNARLNVTGMLLYKDGNFIQALEGKDDVVETLFSHIAGDHTHTGVLVLIRRQIEGREFPEWTMAFQDLGDPNLSEMPGYSEFINDSFHPASFQKDPSKARRLLDVFRHNLQL